MTLTHSQRRGSGGGDRREPPREPPPVAGRVPPHDIEAEEAVLSAVLSPEGREALDRVLEILAPEHFYVEQHQIIFTACVELSQSGQPIDWVTVNSWLRARELVQRVGGVTTLARLIDATPAVAHVATHARTVKEKWRLRRVIAACQKYAAEGYGDVGEAQQFIDSCEQSIYEIARTPESTTVLHLKDVLIDTFKQINAAAERGGAVTGIPSGFADLDKKTAGLHKGDLLIVAARPGMGKCLSADAEIVEQDGRVSTIGEIFNRKRARLLTLGADWKLAVASPSHYVDDGVKPVFRVTTRLGRRVETTLPHPFLTMRGWRPLAELAVGERVAVPRQLGVFGNQPLPESEVKILGYLIGDGGLTGGTATFTNTNPRLLADFTEAVRSIDGLYVRTNNPRDHRRAPTLAVAGDASFIEVERPAFGKRLREAMAARGVTARALAASVQVSPALVSNWLSGQCVPSRAAFEAVSAKLQLSPEDLAPFGLTAISRMAKNRLVERLEELGLMGKGAAEKLVPVPIFTLPRAQLALFLNRLFATDGWATVLASGQAQLGYATTSERLARQVQHLLLRFGIIAALRRRMVKYAGSRRQAFQLDITYAPSIRLFASEIGAFGKEEAVWAAVEACSNHSEHANRDVIPVEVWETLRASKRDESWASLARRAGLRGASNIHVDGRGLSRRRLASLAEALADHELARIAASDVYWDEIVSIDPLGTKQVYDLTIPDTHNFVADDVCVHNTSFVLNVAVNVATPQRLITPGPDETGYGEVESQLAGHGVAVFSLEMPRDQVAQRLLCSEARVDVGRLRQGHLAGEDWKKLMDGAAHLSPLEIYIDDAPGLGILELRAKVRRLQAELMRKQINGRPHPGLGLVVIDYMQLMTGRKGAASREQEISEISRGLKQLAKELSVPVIALSQLNRAVETRGTKDKRPLLSDLRESGAIEQDADTIVFIYRDEYYARLEQRETQSPGMAELIIAKQRNGPTGTVNVRFEAQYTRFDNLAPGQYGEYPE